jgi:membrane protein DedA with SNARE-associated domain
VFNNGAVWVYLAIFGSLVAAGFGFPIPEELPIVAAGGLAGHQASEPDTVVVYPQHLALLGADAGAPFPANLPWMPLAQTFSEGPLPPECVGVLAADPQAPFPANLPWPALAASTAPAAPPPYVVENPKPLRWWILLPVCILGVVISDGLLYTMGRIGGRKIFKLPWMRRLLPEARFARIESNFHKYGVIILLFARLLPGIRGPIFLSAGILKLSWRRFLLADGIYAIPGVSLLFFLAFWFTDQFIYLVKRAEEGVGRLRPILILSLIVGVCVYFLIHFVRKPVTTGDPQELPLIGEQVAAKIEGPEHEEVAGPGEGADEARRAGGVSPPMT